VKLNNGACMRARWVGGIGKARALAGVFGRRGATGEEGRRRRRMNEDGKPNGGKGTVRDEPRGGPPGTTTEPLRMRLRSGRMSGETRPDVRDRRLLWLRTAEDAKDRLGAMTPRCARPSVCHGAVMHARG
jgi:hypothetical protein